MKCLFVFIDFFGPTTFLEKDLSIVMFKLFPLEDAVVSKRRQVLNLQRIFEKYLLYVFNPIVFVERFDDEEFRHAWLSGTVKFVPN